MINKRKGEDMIQYDTQGRMLYNPEFHDNHKKPWERDDLIYLCSMHEGMTRSTLSMALGRTETTVSTKLYELQKQGKYEYYRKLGKAI